MDILHVYARQKADLKLPEEYLKQLPEKLCVVTTIQYLHLIDEVVDQVKGIKGGQILGCRTETATVFKDKVDAYLYVGSGTFHPIAVSLNTEKPVYCYNPQTKELKLLPDDVIQRFKTKQKVALSKYYAADVVGILVSSKTGQSFMSKAIQLINKEKEKKFYIFAYDTLDIHYLRDFPFIQSWVNTACPRIADEKIHMVNIDVIFPEAKPAKSKIPLMYNFLP